MTDPSFSIPPELQAYIEWHTATQIQKFAELIVQVEDEHQQKLNQLQFEIDQLTRALERIEARIK